MRRIREFFNTIKEKKEEKHKLKVNLELFHTRLHKLEVAMDLLVSDHMVMESIEDYYPYINKYIDCKDDNEYNYCKDYINSKVRKGYLRYDDERLQ